MAGIQASHSVKDDPGCFIDRALALELPDHSLVAIAQTLRQDAAQARDDLLMTRASLVLGKIYVAQHQYLEALEILESAANQLGKLSIEEKKQYFLVLGKSYIALNRFEPLIAQSVEWLRLATMSNDGIYEIQVHSLLGSLHVALGILDTALTHFDRALQLSNALSLPPPPHLLYALSRFYYAKEDDANALYYFEAALSQAVLEKDQSIESMILNNIGILYSKQRDYGQAASYYFRALKVAKNCADASSITLICNNLGVDLIDQKRFHSAKRYLRLALQYHQRIPSISREALIKGNLGEIAMLTGDLEAARQLLHESLLLAEQSKDSRRLQERYEDLSLFYEHIGDLENSLKYYKMFHQQKLQLVESSASARGMLIQNKFELEKLRQEQEIHRLKNIELAEAVRQLEQLSHQDGLTGLYNRRFFDTRFQQLLEQHQQGLASFCLMLADIDNFKAINDTFSHTVGDEVLKIVADIFMKTLRGSDIVARYGGEEIVVLFSKTKLENARRACENVRQAIEGYPWEQVREGLKVTVSMGLVDSWSQPERMLMVADARLYVAKHNGKNRLES